MRIVMQMGSKADDDARTAGSLLATEDPLLRGGEGGGRGRRDFAFHVNRRQRKTHKIT